MYTSFTLDPVFSRALLLLLMLLLHTRSYAHTLCTRFHSRPQDDE